MSSPNAKAPRGGVSHDHRRNSDFNAIANAHDDLNLMSGDQIKKVLAAKQAQCKDLEDRLAVGQHFQQTLNFVI